MSEYKIVRYLGVDWGQRRIGLAVGDSETGIATPLTVVDNADEVIRTAIDEKVDLIVVGKPVKMSGREELSAEFEDFVGTLKIKSSLPVQFSDERLSSKAADALPGDKKVKAPRDALAAMLILQSYLDSVH